MNILSFNKVKQDELLQKSQQARSRRRYREAYDFLREALRYGEDAAILARAAALLNEMGEYEAALQVSVLAVGKEKECAPARWEMAVSLERMWDIEEAIEVLSELDDRKFPDAARLLCTCHLKKGDVEGARKFLFRMSHKAGLSMELKQRCDRFEQLGRTRLGLRDWKWIMHRHLLVHERGERAFQFHHVFGGGSAPEAKGFGRDATAFEGEHYVVGHPSFSDCARVLAALEDFLAEHSGRYSGVASLGESARPVALFLSRLLGLQFSTARTGSDRRPLLLVMGTNRDRPTAPPGGFFRHDLFIFMKSFEREEFYDVVAPPHNRVHLGRWAEPIRTSRLQIIGALGEWIALPWERPAGKASSGRKVKVEPVWGEFSGEDAMDSNAAADLLWSSYRRLRKGAEGKS